MRSARSFIKRMRFRWTGNFNRAHNLADILYRSDLNFGLAFSCIGILIYASVLWFHILMHRMYSTLFIEPKIRFLLNRRLTCNRDFRLVVQKVETIVKVYFDCRGMKSNILITWSISDHVLQELWANTPLFWRHIKKPRWSQKSVRLTGASLSIKENGAIDATQKCLDIRMNKILIHAVLGDRLIISRWKRTQTLIINHNCVVRITSDAALALLLRSMRSHSYCHLNRERLVRHRLRFLDQLRARSLHGFSSSFSLWGSRFHLLIFFLLVSNFNK